MDHINDLVLDFKLDTQFLDGSSVKHIRHVQGPTARQRRVQVEEVWEVTRLLGRGAYGLVRFESRRRRQQQQQHQQQQQTSAAVGPLESQNPSVRAVKVISKTTTSTQSQWNYLKELEALLKFSHPRYAPYFVRTYGWFEDTDSVYIALEYFRLGDLERFMRSSPPFSERAARQITQQILEGCTFMHASGFAHRDLKPANLLVESTSPDWLVKIADFGISKRAQDGGTDLRTMHIGTFGYMAPEVITFNAANEREGAYSVSVDIWAVGVIAFELLFKRHPFTGLMDLAAYIQGSRHLDLAHVRPQPASPECKGLIRQLLAPKPENRPSAAEACRHPWISTQTPAHSQEESIFLASTPRHTLTSQIVAATPASVPWSHLNAGTNRSTSTVGTGTLLTEYQGPGLNAGTLLPEFQHLSLEATRYFVLRSDNATDIETSAALNTWTSSTRVNKMLQKGYARSNGQVVLFFSVIASRKFCGVAQMMTPMDWVNTDEHWLEDNWSGRFEVNWLILDEMSFDRVKHVPVSARTPGFRAIACYDGTEIEASSAYELLHEYTKQRQESQQTQGSRQRRPQRTLDSYMSPRTANRSQPSYGVTGLTNMARRLEVGQGF